MIQPSSRLPNIYAVAIKTLEDLKSGPFCHQIAAVMLHNNCQLLEKIDDPNGSGHSGQKMTDFVDSYAASLAICDLERGSFSIPSACSKLQEESLRKLTNSGSTDLHVSTEEIEACLAGLGKDASAWNTWVNYKHKAYMICEAGKADSNKAQSILLYERLAKVVEQLVNGIEEEMQKKMTKLETRVDATSKKLDLLNPRVAILRDSIGRALELVRTEMEESLKRYNNDIKKGAEKAKNLEDMVSKLLNAIQIASTDVGETHQRSLALLNRQANNELSALVNTVAATAASTAALQQEIELSRLQSESFNKRQVALEEGMDRLAHATTKLITMQEHQGYQIALANNITLELLNTLEMVSTSASVMTFSLSQSLSNAGSKWWPYLLCPIASLVMGSYGLPPSAVRNIGLIILGEAAGYFVSAFYLRSFPNLLMFLDDSTLFRSTGLK